MKLTVISDLHDSIAHVEALRRACETADALVVCGDFTTFGDQDRVQSMADIVAADGKPCLFVIGNCDTLAVDGRLEGWQNLHGRVVAVGDWLFAGFGGSLPCPSHTPSEFPEGDFDRLLARVKAECGGRADRLIVVSHQPPFDTKADLLPSGQHVGSRALKTFIDDVQPACFLTGHIHEAASRSTVGRTLLVNPGPFSRGHLAVVEL